MCCLPIAGHVRVTEDTQIAVARDPSDLASFGGTFDLLSLKKGDRLTLMNIRWKEAAGCSAFVVNLDPGEDRHTLYWTWSWVTSKVA